MGCIIARHVAAAVTARGRTTAEEHKALNARITLHPTDVLLSFNSFFLCVLLSLFLCRLVFFFFFNALTALPRALELV